MNRYELITKCKKENDFTNLITSGLISIKIANWYDVYIYFLALLETKKEVTAKDRFAFVTQTAEYWNVCETTVYNIIRFMES